MPSIRFRILPALMIGVMAVSSLAFTGCDRKGPGESLGERVDEGARDTKRSVEDATD